MSPYHPRRRTRPVRFNDGLKHYGITMNSGGNSYATHATVYQKGSRWLGIKTYRRLTLHTGGIKSRQTLNSMQSIARHFGTFSMRQRDHRWYITVGNEEFRYYDGIVIDTTGWEWQIPFYHEGAAVIENEWLERVDNFVALATPLWVNEGPSWVKAKETLHNSAEIGSDIHRPSPLSVKNTLLSQDVNQVDSMIGGAMSRWFDDFHERMNKNPMSALKLLGSFLRLRMGLVVQ